MFCFHQPLVSSSKCYDKMDEYTVVKSDICTADFMRLQQDCSEMIRDMWQDISATVTLICPTLCSVTTPFYIHIKSCFAGLQVACWLWYPSSLVKTLPKPSDFSGRKNPQHAFLRKGSKAVFFLNVTWKSGIFRQNSSTISRPSSSSFHY